MDQQSPSISIDSPGDSVGLVGDPAPVYDLSSVAAPEAWDAGAAPWRLTFSYARALQQPALDTWRGDNANTGPAQQALLHRARCNRAAAQGEYDPSQERQVA